MDPVFTQQFNMPAPHPESGGMFGGGGKFGIGQAIVAALNGYLAGTGNPVGMQNMQMIAAMRQRQMERQQGLEDYNRKRTDENSDWQSHYQYEIDHPKPTAGSEFERVAQLGGYQPGTPEYSALMKQKADEMADPVVMTQYGPMLRSQALKMGGGQPAPAGVTFTPVDGGQTGAPSGGFPY